LIKASAGMVRKPETPRVGHSLSMPDSTLTRRNAQGWREHYPDVAQEQERISRKGAKAQRKDAKKAFNNKNYSTA
jgi:hypothetical protein